MSAREKASETTGFLRQTVVLIPALNEEASVAQTVRRWLDLGAAQVRVVDNGSQDRTADVARCAGAEVMAEPCRGYGAAAWRGLMAWPTQCPWVLFSSADGSDRMSSSDVALWQRAVDEGADIVLGNRMGCPRSRALLSRSQRFGNRLCCRAIERWWDHRFEDMGSLRLVRRRTMDRLNLSDRAFGWNLEMQVRAVELKVKIFELPIDYYSRSSGRSKISGNLKGSVQAGIGILQLLLRLQGFRLTRLAVKGRPGVA